MHRDECEMVRAVFLPRPVAAEGAALHWDGTEAPARVLAALERVGATHLVADGGLLARLRADPAAPLTDLAAVRDVELVGSGITAAEVTALFPEAAVREAAVREAAGREAAVRPVPADVVAAAAAEAGDVPGMPSLGATRELVRRLDAAVLLSMLRALQAGGRLTDPGRADAVAAVVASVRVAEPHVALVNRWLGELAAAGRLARAVDGYRGAPAVAPAVEAAAWDDAERAWAAGFGGPGFVAYLRRNAERLGELLTGELTAVSLLFPQGRTTIADAVYRDTVTARYLNAAIAGAVRAIAATGRRRVLEVGAGTCATSEVVLAAVPGLDYTVTDVSAFFLAGARSRLRDVRFAVLDVQRPPAEQGFAAGCTDVVVAAGVLNAAADAAAAVRGLATLLSPGGWMLVSEPTREHLEILASQAFMMSPPRDARARTGTTFLDRAQWTAVFDGAGLELRAILPGEDHPLAPLGQRLFLVHAPG